MAITESDQFITICRHELVKTYNSWAERPCDIVFQNTFCVSMAKELKNFKGQFSTNIDGDGVYFEYTYNGQTGELYEDFYVKKTNRAISKDVLDQYFV